MGKGLGEEVPVGEAIAVREARCRRDRTTAGTGACGETGMIRFVKLGIVNSLQFGATEAVSIVTRREL